MGCAPCTAAVDTSQPGGLQKIIVVPKDGLLSMVAGPLVCEQFGRAKICAELIDAGTVPENYIQPINAFTLTPLICRYGLSKY